MNADYFELIKAFIGAFLGGAAVYAAIKSDIADLKARMVITEKTANDAHTRINDILIRDTKQ